MGDGGKKKSKSVLIGTLAALILTAICVVFSVLCLAEYRSGFIFRNRDRLIVAACAVLFAYAAFSVFFLASGKGAAFRVTISGYALLIFCLLVLFILQRTGFFEIIKSAENFREYLEKTGALMPVAYIALQFLQVVLLPVPGFVSTAAGVALFGPTLAMICSLIGVIAGSLTAFIIGRKIGYKAVSWVVGEENLDKWLKKVKGKDNFVLTLMFLLPLFPDDILCFIAGLSSMTWQYFVAMISVSRILAIAATCYSVNFIPVGTWWGALFWILAIAGVIVLFVVLYKHLDELNAWFKRKFRSKKRPKEHNRSNQNR